MKWRFAGRFLLAFAVALVLWWAVDFATIYRTVVLAMAEVLSPVVNGWWLEYGRSGAATEVIFRSGERQIPLLLQLPALSMGLVPFLSLVVATPGLGLRRTVVAVVLGSFLFMLVHVVVVLVYPLVMDRPNAVKDTVGVFSGLVAFVVTPLALWFALTYPALRPLWRLTSSSPRAE